MAALETLLLQVLVVLLACRLVGSLFRLIGQPAVVGEMFAGIFLGPSLLGWLAPGFTGFLFPPSSLGPLSILSQLGLIFFMFLVGMRVNLQELKSQGHAAILASHASISLPFFSAVVFSLYLYPRLSDQSVSFTSFALFMGAAMSITAFPVLARILTERRMLDTKLGTIVIACAAVDDVSGWCIFGSVVVLVRSAHTGISMWLRFAGILVFVLGMIFCVRYFLRAFETAYRHQNELRESLMLLLSVLVLGSALCTELLGIHPLFGAFLLGAIMPKQEQFVAHITERFHSFVLLLLPLFFAFTGLRTNVNFIHGADMWIPCVLIILVATAGKFGGSMLAGWLSDMSLDDSCKLGVLMNTRGLMELIILNIGLEIKIISPALFCMMVIMALATTFMTTPLLDWISAKEERRTANQISAEPQSVRQDSSAA